MRKFTISLLLASLMSLSSYADELRLQDNAPTRYTVVKGDTLWDISGRFLKDPWKWPQIWGMNKAEIKNPHWIYPGDVVVLDTSGATPRLSLVKSNSGHTVKLSPKVRGTVIDDAGILPIPASAINAFINQPFVMEKGALDNAPRILSAEEDRMVLGGGDQAFATSDGSKTTNWKILRPGKALIDPDTKEVLGYEVEYLGEARTIVEGNPQRILITAASQEIEAKDRLKSADETYSFRYVPHAPSGVINGKVISAYGGLAEAGQYTTIVINKGQRDGLEEGNVLAVYKNGGKVDGVTLPDTRSGLIMVYRVFEKVSYALVMQTNRPVNLLDFVRNP
ncbi:LysM peptidoglycan-binding domain-containing protein [Sulfuriferula thiophila]|uniref:LysM peptidoglycan-binding domain-containing protein n=1 Tax=Sulfuriferula thiophila TaxID=1781211 RepID=UPI000F60FD57|nr:LysM peptidoglycan-binding domain-containing protein [Sulfuriferula thiophila]